MAGTYVRPKSYERHFYIDIGTESAPVWAELARGITSRSNSFSTDETQYYDMAGQGSPETETEGQTITRSFTGFRVFGDEAQDKIFMDMLYDLDHRETDFMEYYANMPTGKPNGWKGSCTITITDDGSGDAKVRENIGVTIAVNGKPQQGTVTIEENGAPTFTPKV